MIDNIAELTWRFLDDFVSYVIVKLHSVASGTPLVKGNQPYYDQEFVL